MLITRAHSVLLDLAHLACSRAIRLARASAYSSCTVIWSPRATTVSSRNSPLMMTHRTLMSMHQASRGCTTMSLLHLPRLAASEADNIQTYTQQQWSQTYTKALPPLDGMGIKHGHAFGAAAAQARGRERQADEKRMPRCINVCVFKASKIDESHSFPCY